MAFDSLDGWIAFRENDPHLRAMGAEKEFPQDGQTDFETGWRPADVQLVNESLKRDFPLASPLIVEMMCACAQAAIRPKEGIAALEREGRRRLERVGMAAQIRLRDAASQNPSSADRPPAAS